MAMATIARTIDSLNRNDRPVGQEELRAETIQIAIRGVFGLGFCVLAFGAIGLNQVDAQIFALVAGLWAVAFAAQVAYRHRPIAAAGIVVVGLVCITTAALLFLPGPILAPWFAFAVLLAGALLGWRLGIVTALVATGILLLAAWRLPAPIPGEIAMSATLLSGASLFVAWLLTRPTRIALGWAWSSYSQALDQTKAARERQAELVRLSKGLSESYYQLEQLNLELERARRAAQEARRLKAEFAASVSHELRTPLNLIIGFCEMMVLSPSVAYGQRLPAHYQTDLEAIYRNACHISTLVDDILDLSQIDADRMALHKEWTSLAGIVDEAVSTVQGLFLDRELTVRTILPDNLPRSYVDQTRIRQILINLLSNAARFLEQGGVTVRAEPESDSVVISVADTGPGIPAEELPGVFEEFYQVQLPHRRRGGSGLGLTVSKRFAELHGGTMWVESTLGEGSTFFLKLPLGDDGELPTLGTLDADDRVSKRVRGQAERRILVIDETGEVGKVFQRYLDGYQVLPATSVARAQRLLKPGPIHAIVLGSPAARTEWNSLSPVPADLARLSVISCPLHTARQTAEALGVQGYLVKPVTREQLRSEVRRLDRPVRSALVVDDDEEMTRLLSRMLKSIARGCRVATARDGRAAIEALQTQRPDLVLLDLLMPEMTGYAVVDALHQDADLREIPVLVVTARGLQDETVIASEFSVTRDGGMTVGEVMRWLKSGLDSLVGPGTGAPTPPGALVS